MTRASGQVEVAATRAELIAAAQGCEVMARTVVRHRVMCETAFTAKRSNQQRLARLLRRLAADPRRRRVVLFRLDAWALGEVWSWLNLCSMGGFSWAADAEPGMPFLRRCKEAATARRGQPRLSLAGIRVRLTDDRLDAAQRSRLAKRVAQEERREARQRLGYYDDPPE